MRQAGATEPPAQYLVLVDRSPQVQAAYVYFTEAGALPRLIGVSPASTGRPGRFDYFETPTMNAPSLQEKRSGCCRPSDARHPGPGRYLIVVDSRRTQRPAWARPQFSAK